MAAVAGGDSFFSIWPDIHCKKCGSKQAEFIPADRSELIPTVRARAGVMLKAKGGGLAGPNWLENKRERH